MTILIPNLPAANALASGDQAVVAQGDEIARRTTLGAVKDFVAPLASQAEAEAGSENTKVMTALRARQGVLAMRASQAEAEAGSASDKLMTPERSTQAITARLATQAEAQAGSDNTKLMTPVRTAQAVAASLATQLEAEAGTNSTKLMTPERTRQSISASVPSFPAADPIESTDLIGVDQGAGQAKAAVQQVADFAVANGAFLQSGTGATSRTATAKMREVVSVADFGADLTGATNSTTALLNAIASVATNGGVVKIPPGSRFSIQSAVTINAANVYIDARGATLAMAGQGRISWVGAGVQASATLNANAAIYARQISLSTSAGLVAGSIVYIQRDAPANGGATALWALITRVVSITGSGPFTVTLSDPLPFSLSVGVAGLQISRVSMVSGGGFIGGTVDASAMSGSACSAVESFWHVGGTFQDIDGSGCSIGSTLHAQFGLENTFQSIVSRSAGNSSYAGVFLIAQSRASAQDIRSASDSGFGAMCQGWSYGSTVGLMGAGSGGRGVKTQACLASVFGFSNGSGNAFNGVAIAIGTQRCVFVGIIAHANPSLEGIWLSDQFNTENVFVGCVAYGNGTGSGARDILVGPTDTGNVFIGSRYGRMENNTNTTVLLGANGNVIMGGSNGDGFGPAPQAVLRLTGNGTALIPPRGAGGGSERWFGADNSDLNFWSNVPTGGSFTFALNNNRLVNMAADGVRFNVAASTTPNLNSEACFQLTSNTTFRVVVRGSDGIVRVGPTWTLT